jgi:hypothetical protein
MASELVAYLEAANYQVRRANTKTPVNAADDFASQHFDIVATPR